MSLTTAWHDHADPEGYAVTYVYDADDTVVSLLLVRIADGTALGEYDDVDELLDAVAEDRGAP